MTSISRPPMTAGADVTAGWAARWRHVHQRRPGWVAAAITFVALAMLVNVAVFRSASDRAPVVRMVRDVPIGQALTLTDLGTAMVAVDAGVRTIPVRRLPELVGLRAAVSLRHGSLLTDFQVTARLTPQPGQALVTVTLRSSALPPRGLPAGTRVRIVSTSMASDQDGFGADSSGVGPADAGAAGPAGRGIDATVDQVGRPDVDGGTPVGLIVADADSGAVAEQASTHRIALVITALGG